jgi:hypothetical protein
MLMRSVGGEPCAVGIEVDLQDVNGPRVGLRRRRATTSWTDAVAARRNEPERCDERSA